MNVFVLDKNPKKAAEYHCNKHVVKMILETCQMMTTACWVDLLHKRGKKTSDFKKQKDMQAWLFENVTEDLRPTWRMTHINHPCSVWTRESMDNYWWLGELGINLLLEYSARYKKIHSTTEIFDWLFLHPPGLASKGLTPHPICMPELYKKEDNVVESYRRFYIGDKSRFAKWEPRAQTPEWYNEGIQSLSIQS
jgi:hypothetical protein